MTDRTGANATPEPAACAEDALALLPTAHAVLLRLERAGVGHDQMAVALGVPVEAIPTLLQVAWAKWREREAHVREEWT